MTEELVMPIYYTNYLNIFSEISSCILEFYERKEEIYFRRKIFYNKKNISIKEKEILSILKKMSFFFEENY